MLKKPLNEQVPLIEKSNLNITAAGKRAYIVGSFLSNVGIARVIEKAGFHIVGDYLPESGRLLSTKDTEGDGDVYVEISQSILSAYSSPTQNSFEDILEMISNEIKEKHIDCVFYITQKYCEPYDYLYVTYKSMLDSMNIPVLHLILNDSEDDRKITLEEEAFADTVN